MVTPNRFHYDDRGPNRADRRAAARRGCESVRSSERVSKAEWYAVGGFANPRCWRRGSARGGWQYYIRKD